MSARDAKAEFWEQEVLSKHRWGAHGKARAREEVKRLRELREPLGEFTPRIEQLVGQIVGPEICNWRLEEMMLVLCGAIGKKEPLPFGTGHKATVTDERYGSAWAYYLSLRSWQFNNLHDGFRTLLTVCDLSGEIERHIREMLGERTRIKELYVERLCLCLEVLFGEVFPEDSGRGTAHRAAVKGVERAIRKVEPGSAILDAIREYRCPDRGECLAYAGLEFCHHKFFRRLDIVISSIGSGKWRETMPERGTDGFERAEAAEKHLAPVEAWLEGNPPADDSARDVFDRLGEPDETKVFLASLLVSLMKAQALSARKRAEDRVGK